MSRTIKGLTLALVMLLGALALTGLLATSLQQRAQESLSTPGGYSPREGATVDERGWPVDEPIGKSPANAANTGRSRGRSSSGPAGLDA